MTEQHDGRYLMIDWWTCENSSQDTHGRGSVSQSRCHSFIQSVIQSYIDRQPDQQPDRLINCTGQHNPTISWHLS